MRSTTPIEPSRVSLASARRAETSRSAGTFHVRLRTEQERADRHGRPLGIVSFAAATEQDPAALELLQSLARARLRATDWVGPVQGGAIGVLLPFTAQADSERLAAELQ